MPQRETSENPRRYYGKHAGVVLDNGPPETGPHRGVLQVEVSSILEEAPSGMRPIQLRAHPCLPPGFFFLPRKGDHVWVEFASGELEQPIWTGVWYPEGSAPPDAEGAAPTAGQKVIRTDSHVLTLDDDRESVVIQDGKGHRIELNADGIRFKDGKWDVRLDQIIDWLLAHQHLGNMGSPTPLFVQSQIETEPWKDNNSSGGA